MIVVTAKITARTGKEKELEAAFRKMAADVASETGTLMYSLHRSQNDPAVFFFYEQYIDGNALQHHSSTPYFKALMQTLQPLVAAPPEIEKFDLLTKLDR